MPFDPDGFEAHLGAHGTAKEWRINEANQTLLQLFGEISCHATPPAPL